MEFCPSDGTGILWIFTEQYASACAMNLSCFPSDPGEDVYSSDLHKQYAKQQKTSVVMGVMLIIIVKEVRVVSDPVMTDKYRVTQ